MYQCVARFSCRFNQSSTRAINPLRLLTSGGRRSQAGAFASDMINQCTIFPGQGFLSCSYLLKLWAPALCSVRHRRASRPLTAVSCSERTRSRISRRMLSTSVSAITHTLEMCPAVTCSRSGVAGPGVRWRTVARAFKFAIPSVKVRLVTLRKSAASSQS